VGSFSRFPNTYARPLPAAIVLCVFYGGDEDLPAAAAALVARAHANADVSKADPADGHGPRPPADDGDAIGVGGSIGVSGRHFGLAEGTGDAGGEGPQSAHGDEPAGPPTPSAAVIGGGDDVPGGSGAGAPKRRPKKQAGAVAMPPPPAGAAPLPPLPSAPELKKIDEGVAASQPASKEPLLASVEETSPLVQKGLRSAGRGDDVAPPARAIPRPPKAPGKARSSGGGDSLRDPGRSDKPAMLQPDLSSRIESWSPGSDVASKEGMAVTVADGDDAGTWSHNSLQSKAEGQPDASANGAGAGHGGAGRRAATLNGPAATAAGAAGSAGAGNSNSGEGTWTFGERVVLAHAIMLVALWFFRSGACAHRNFPNCS
jgi:hypothetical protein